VAKRFGGLSQDALTALSPHAGPSRSQKAHVDRPAGSVNWIYEKLETFGHHLGILGSATLEP